MKQIVTAGKLIEIVYQISDFNNTVLKVSGASITYLHGGSNEMFPKIERALHGNSIGDRVVVDLNPADAFGEHSEDMVFVDKRRNVPVEYHVLGIEAEFQNNRGQQKIFRVTAIDEETLTFDGNHPLAGMALRFTVTIVDIRDPVPDDSGSAPNVTPTLH